LNILLCKSLQLFLTFILAAFVLSDEYHPCKRKCIKGENLVCKYKFKVQNYRSASKSCGDCFTSNSSHCFHKNCIPADGYARPIVVINRKLPGPKVSVCEGDTVNIEVTNYMEEGTTIHWHGIHQRNTSYMDGVPMVTQCPITKHSSFTYKFKAYPSGTHWYHSHNGLQRGDGAAGPFVVRKPEEHHRNLYDIDSDDHIVFLSDWFHVTSHEKFSNLLYGNVTFALESENILINGKGLRSKNFDNSFPTPLEVFYVEKNFRYRFRLISNAVQYCPLEVSIDQHNITIISSDGNDLKPITVSKITINGGERFDFVLNANQPESDYLLNVKGIKTTECSQNTQRSMIRYKNKKGIKSFNSARIKTVNKSIPSLNQIKQQTDTGSNSIYISDLLSVDNISERYLKVDKTIFLSLDYTKVNYGKFMDPDLKNFYLLSQEKNFSMPTINEYTNKFPNRPLLHHRAEKAQLCKNTNKVASAFTPCVHLLKIKHKSTVELVLFDQGNLGTESGHPMHLHGHSFAVVAQGRL